MNVQVSEESAARWRIAHEQLDAMVREVCEQLDVSPDRARAAMERLVRAVEHHFDVEERSLLPLVARYAPEHAVAVRHAVHAHGEILGRLIGLGRLLDSADSDTLQCAFGDFMRRFAAHEAAESSLIEALRRHADTFSSERCAEQRS